MSLGPACHARWTELGKSDGNMRLAPIFLALALGAAACSPGGVRRNAAAARSAPSLGDDEELGRLADQRVLTDVQVFSSPALDTYVGTILRSVGKFAEPSPSRWHLRLLDSSHISIRSGPGGYVYVTRGLLACLSSEAELAAALAHEVAHISQRDWRRQAEYLVEHGVEDGDLDKLRSDERLRLLSRLRAEEHVADTLALDYLKRAGYAGGGLLAVVRLFAELERLAGGSRVPAVLRTHPDTGARLKAIAQQIGSGGTWRKREYLAKVNGLPFGESPRTGYLYGDRYVVPDSDFELTLPAIWRARLIGRDLMAALPGKATIVIVARSEHGSLEQTLSALGERERFAETTLGARRAFVLSESAGERLEARTYVFDTPGAPLVMALVLPQSTTENVQVRALLEGASKISDPALRELGQLHVRLTTLSEESSLRALFARSPPHTNLATFAMINGVGPDEPLPAGSIVKRIDP